MLDDSGIRNYTGLWDDHYPVADEVSVAVELRLMSLVQYLNARTDACVLIDDRALDEAVWSDPDAGITAIDVRLQLVEILVEISSHHQHSVKPRAMLDSAPNPDDRIRNGGPVDDAA